MFRQKFPFGRTLCVIICPHTRQEGPFWDKNCHIKLLSYCLTVQGDHGGLTLGFMDFIWLFPLCPQFGFADESKAEMAWLIGKLVELLN